MLYVSVPYVHLFFCRSVRVSPICLICFILLDDFSGIDIKNEWFGVVSGQTSEENFRKGETLFETSCLFYHSATFCRKKNTLKGKSLLSRTIKAKSFWQNCPPCKCVHSLKRIPVLQTFRNIICSAGISIPTVRSLEKGLFICIIA